MKPEKRLPKLAFVGLLAVGLTLATTVCAQAAGQPAVQPAGQSPPVAERVTALKGSLAESQAKLKGYEWIETTVVSVKGDEKSNTMKRCYYGADNKVQKIPVAAEPAPAARRGIIGRVVANKQAELTESMKQAAELVHQYIPPSPEAIQKSKDAGKVTLAILEPGKRIRLEFSDYLVAGDALKVEIALSDNSLSAISVSTSLSEKDDKNAKKDPVTFDVRMGSLKDGTTYAEETTLELKAQDLKVVVTNSGYRKAQN